MPIYVWKCKHCGQIVEELRKMGDFEPPKEQECSCGEICEFVQGMTTANFRIDPAAG